MMWAQALWQQCGEFQQRATVDSRTSAKPYTQEQASQGTLPSQALHPRRKNGSHWSCILAESLQILAASTEVRAPHLA